MTRPAHPENASTRFTAPLPASLAMAVDGNCAFSALIDPHARVVWCCLPRCGGNPGSAPCCKGMHHRPLTTRQALFRPRSKTLPTPASGTSPTPPCCAPSCLTAGARGSTSPTLHPALSATRGFSDSPRWRAVSSRCPGHRASGCRWTCAENFGDSSLDARVLLVIEVGIINAAVRLSAPWDSTV